MKKCLFIAGPWDGRREVPFGDCRIFRVADRIGMSIHEHIYRKERLRDSTGTDHVIFVHESIKEGEMIQRLIDGYSAK